MNNLFPITIKAYDTGQYIRQPPFRKTFRDNKPADMTYYAFDVTLTSKTECMFTVYDVSGMCSGGIGEVRGEFDAVLDEEEISKFLVRHILRLARDIEEDEFYHTRQARVEQIRKGLMSEYKVADDEQ